MRHRIPLEAFDPVTLWPVRTFDGYIAAEAAGYKRSSIALCVAGKRRQHAGYGWRMADAASRLPEFVRFRCHVGDVPPADCVDCAELLSEFRIFVGESGYNPRTPQIIRHRFGVEFVETPEHNAYDCPSYRQVIRGLRWL